MHSALFTMLPRNYLGTRFLGPRFLGTYASRMNLEAKSAGCGQGHGRPEGVQTTFRTRECGHEPAFEENFILRNLIRGLGT